MKKGFTLIELLVVIAIIGVLSSIVISSLNDARQKSRDTQRLSQIRQMQTQLDLYFDKYGRYPSSDGDGCGGWDTGNATYNLLGGNMDGWKTPRDMNNTSNCSGLRYYRYGAGDYGCPAAKGAYYVLGFSDEPTRLGTNPASGWSCPSRNWQGEFTFVTGRFENDK